MAILLAEFATNTNNDSPNNGTYFKVASESHLCSSLKDRYTLALTARPNVLQLDMVWIYGSGAKD